MIDLDFGENAASQPYHDVSGCCTTVRPIPHTCPYYSIGPEERIDRFAAISNLHSDYFLSINNKLYIQFIIEVHRKRSNHHEVHLHSIFCPYPHPPDQWVYHSINVKTHYCRNPKDACSTAIVAVTYHSTSTKEKQKAIQH